MSLAERPGPGADDGKEARALNRVVRWCEDRIEYEADPRQAERLIPECGLSGAKSVATPGVKATFSELESDEPLGQRLHTPFRGSAARSNYLCADRVDIQFAGKEVCRYMAEPTPNAWNSVKRICRFLVGQPRLVYTYPKQTIDHIDVYTDTDWAGCPLTRNPNPGSDHVRQPRYKALVIDAGKCNVEFRRG